jgi:prepilin-type N-terminal cleavage/methylation domain-containing protein
MRFGRNKDRVNRKEPSVLGSAKEIAPELSPNTINLLIESRHARHIPDSGFTLIEIMVTLLILAILLAIAIPTFLGVTNSANDRSAQSNLNTAMLNAKAAYRSNNQSYGAPNIVNSTLLKSAEPTLSFTAANSSGPGVISVFPTSDGKAIVLASLSKSNSCWYLVDNPQGGTAATTPFAAAATGTANTATTTLASGTNIKFLDSKAGTIFVEVKGDSIPGDCKASGPVYKGKSLEWSTAGFPSL